jgi:membrane protease YdiL (CAAX protease family)
LNKKLLLVISVIALLVAGHFLAKYFHDRKNIAWVITAVFYAFWLGFSIYYFSDRKEIAGLFRKPEKNPWAFLPLLLVIPVFVFVFIPNRFLLRPDLWLLVNLVVCLVNPFLEEIFWRGIVGSISSKPLISFAFSTTMFAASHPLIFGVNSPGASGWIGFFATFIAGAAFWLSFHKTKSLRAAVLAHFLIDLAGMAVYVLADRIKLVSF